MSLLSPHKHLGIIGCGWLGKATAQLFIQENWQVRGTARTEDALKHLEKNNISAFRYVLGDSKEKLSAFFSALDLLIISVPPGLKHQSASEYLIHLSLLGQQMQAGLREHTRVLFVSSTGVYPTSGGPYCETSQWKTNSEKSEYLLKAEEVIAQLPFESCVLRLAGLVGKDRDPMYTLSKKNNLKGGNLAANLIHQQDAARLLLHLGTLQELPTFVNGVFPQKIKKGIFYAKKAQQLNIAAPKYTDTDLDLDRHIYSALNLGFKYQNPV
ncbi:MAG: hypothetical protein MRY51_08950 [Flavobacteriaceae bacterium]|nr:hypothetical protein [Flavobacteriaceae bacterium]MCI5089286.1 hypothetical protein [Flavobacteriaceae bacterium]